MAIRYDIPQGAEMPKASKSNIQQSNGLIQNLSGLGARAIEAIGAPLSSIQTIGRVPLEQASQAFETQGMPALAQMAKPTILGQAFEKYAPTSQNIKEKYFTEPVSEILTGNPKYTEPTGPISESLQNLAYTASALFNPLSLIFPSVKGVSAKQALTRATVGEVARTIPKIFGAGEKAENIAHFLGMTTAGALGTRKQLSQQADLDFKSAEKLGEKLPANSHDLKQFSEHSVNALKRRDLPENAKEFLSKRYDSLKELAENQDLNIKDVIKRYRDINDYIRNPETPEQAIKPLESIRENLRNFINENGKSNPEFVRSFNESNELYSALQSLNNLQRFLNKHLPISQFKNPLTRKLMESLLAPTAYTAGIGILGAIGGLKGAAVAAGGGIAANQLYKTYKLIKQSPVAQKAYMDMLAGAAQENANVVIANAKRLDKELTKLEKDETLKNKSKGITYLLPK